MESISQRKRLFIIIHLHRRDHHDANILVLGVAIQKIVHLAKL